MLCILNLNKLIIFKGKNKLNCRLKSDKIIIYVHDFVRDKFYLFFSLTFVTINYFDRKFKRQFSLKTNLIHIIK